MRRERGTRGTRGRPHDRGVGPRSARRGDGRVLSSVGRAIAGTLDLTELLRRVARETARALSADTVAAFLVEPDGHGLRPVAGYHVPARLVEAARATSARLDASRCFPDAWASGRPVVSGAGGTGPRIARATLARFGARSMLFVPVVVKETPVAGLLALWWTRTHRATASELRLVEAFGQQVGLAIESLRLYEEAERRCRESQIVADLGQTLNASLDLDTILQGVAHAARDLCQSDLAHIALRDPATSAMVFRYWAGTRTRGAQPFTVESGKGLGGQALLTRRPVRTDSYPEDPRFSKDYLAAVEAEGIVASMAVPIVSGEEVQGLLFVDNRSPRPFTDREETLLLCLAEQAASAIRNARLYAETERRRRVAEGVIGLGRLVAQSLDPAEVAQRIADSVRSLLAAQASTLYRLEPDSEDLVALAVSGEVGPAGTRMVLRRGTGLSGLAVRDRGPVATTQILADPRVTLTPETRAQIEQAPYRAGLAVPLVGKDGVIGALAVADRGGRVFTDEETRLAESFADQAALALENARLFAETEHRRRQADELARLARTLTETLDVSAVGERIVRSLMPLFAVRSAGLRLLQPDGSMVAVAAADPWSAHAPPGDVLPPGMGISARVLAEGGPVWTEDILRDPRIALPPDRRQWVLASGQHAFLAVPLEVKGRIIGVLSVADRTGRRFGSADADLLRLFADQAAVALENARLYAETSQRLRQTQALLRVAEILGSTLDSRRLLKKVAIKTAQVCEVDRCRIELWEGDRIVPITSQFADGHDEPEPVGFPAAAPSARVPAYAVAAQTRRPVVIPETTGSPLIPPDWITVQGLRACLVAPLIRRGEVVGIMSLDCLKPTDAFQQWQVDLAVTIAGEVALALENARLFTETRNRLRESETLSAVGHVLSLNLPIDEAMRRVAREVARALDADMAGAYFLDARKEALVPMAGYHVPTELRDKLLGTPFPLARFPLLLEAWQSRRPAWTADYRTDPRVDQAFFAEHRPGALLFVPTLLRGDIVGGLFLVWWTPGRSISAAELRLAEGVASQVGLALENAELARQTQEKLRETETLLTVSRALSSTLDLQPLLRHFLRQVARTTGADSVGVWLVDPATGWLEPLSGYRVPRALQAAVRAYRIDPAASPFYAEGIASRRAVLSTNVPEDPRIPAVFKTVVPHRAQLFTPIVAKERVIGAFIAAWWERGRDFSERERALLEAMASQAGMAIANAELFHENQRKVDELSVLHELSRAVTGQLDVARLVEAIHRQVGRVLEARNMVVFLFDETRREFEVALRMLGGEPDPNPVRRYPLGHGLMTRVFERRQAIRTTDYAEACAREGLEPVKTSLGFRHWLGVPLIAGDTALGVLAVRDAVQAFTEADERLLVNIAGLAALAIRSARLYEDRTRAHDELAAAQDQLVRSEKLRALGEMAAGVAHDFNNILAAIMGRAQLLLAQLEDPAQRRQLQIIETAAMDGARTVRRIQEFTRMRRARAFESVDLNQVVEEVVEVTRSRWRDEALAKGVSYEVRVEPTPLPPVAADPSELREVLMNLVFNALDAMPAGGRVTFSTAADGGRVSCVVTDTGVGMTDEVRQRVFDPFFTTKAEKGTGLGLSIAYGIITRHGGSIDVATAPGQGSAFTIRLPVAGAPPGVPPVDAAPGAPRGAKILLIDDEPHVRDVLADLLASQGHAVLACADGRSGLERLRAEPFDLVFTDLGMPGVSGWEVARLARLARPGIPIVLVTGWGDQIDRAEARGRGIDFVVAKPFEANAVKAALAGALASAKRETLPGPGPEQP